MAASFASLVKQILRNHNPDFLFVEPSGMVITKELRDVSVMALRDVSYEIGANITLVDGPMFDSWWVERHQLLIGQMTDSDLVAISKADLLKPEQVVVVREKLGPHVNGAMPLSTFQGSGVDEVVAKIT